MISYLIPVFILIVIIIAVSVYFRASARWLARWFTLGSVIVFGSKGRGKDLIFQKVINVRKKPHYAVMPYGPLTTVLPLREFQAGDNTFHDVIEETIRKFKSNYKRYYDYYISDGGIYLPSQCDVELSKKYPSMPIAFALSRQWWDSAIHINAQNLERIWKKLREQADIYIKAVGRIKLPFLGILVCARYYENYDTAVKGQLPLRIPHKILKTLDKQEVKMMKEQYDATYGIIEQRYFFISYRSIHYDTYYFRDKFLIPLDLPVEH